MNFWETFTLSPNAVPYLLKLSKNFCSKILSLWRQVLTDAYFKSWKHLASKQDFFVFNFAIIYLAWKFWSKRLWDGDLRLWDFRKILILRGRTENVEGQGWGKMERQLNLVPEDSFCVCLLLTPNLKLRMIIPHFQSYCVKWKNVNWM